MDTIETTEPYLSVVVASRNDTHGGDPLARLQTLVNTLSAQCARYGLEAELIVVDWNPPSDRPRLGEVIRRPSACGLTLRFVEVPHDVHATLPMSERLPLFQMIAKNVGIRRARGRFVLSTNIDIILSSELVELLSRRELDPARMYRVDRHDVESTVPVEAPLDEQIEFCVGHQLRVHGQDGTYPVAPNGCPIRVAEDVADGQTVTLGAGWHVREGDAQSGWYRWATPNAQLRIDRSATQWQTDTVLELELEPNPYQHASWCDITITESETLLACRRVSSERSAVTRFCVALADGVPSHDITLQVGASSDGRAFLPLYEGRRGLEYRLRAARLRRLPLAAARAHSFSSRGPLQAHADGPYQFAVVGVGGTGLCVLDDEDGVERPSETTEVLEGEGRVAITEVMLRAGDVFWLRTTGAVPAALTGSVSPSALAPVTEGIGARIRRATMRMRRAVRRSQRRVRAAAAPHLHAWVNRVDSSPVEPPRPSLDDLSGTTDEMTSLRDFLRNHRAPLLHQNACGDFQLMARECWFDLRGFAEFPTYSMSLDGLLSMTAAHAGVVEEVLPMPCCIFHLEHEKGSGWTPEGESLLRKRLADRGVTWVDHRVVRVWGAYMTWLKRPMIFNGADWGFGHVTLPER